MALMVAEGVGNPLRTPENSVYFEVARGEGAGGGGGALKKPLMERMLVKYVGRGSSDAHRISLESLCRHAVIRIRMVCTSKTLDSTNKSRSERHTSSTL